MLRGRAHAESDTRARARARAFIQTSNVGGVRGTGYEDYALLVPRTSYLPLQSQLVHPRGVLRVVVEALPRFPPVHPGEHHALEQGWRRVALLAVLVEHDLGDLVRRVEPDEVQEGERPHRVTGAEAHPRVDVLDRGDAV